MGVDVVPCSAEGGREPCEAVGEGLVQAASSEGIRTQRSGRLNQRAQKTSAEIQHRAHLHYAAEVCVDVCRCVYVCGCV